MPWVRQGWSVPAAWLAPRLAPDADLVHCHCGEDLAIAPIAARVAERRGIPLVLTLHTSLRHTFGGTGPRAAVLRELGGRVERWAVRRAAEVIVLTERTQRLVLADGGREGHVHVIPSGTDPKEFAGRRTDPLAGGPRPRIVFVGRIAAQKGVPVLVEAAARLRTPGARVELVGDGPDRRAVEALIARHGLEDRVRIHGFLPHAQVPGALSHADVVVLPSLYEELGSVLVEAMQAGAAIVASDTGGIPDAVGDAAVLVPPDDPEALAGALDGLLADPARAERLRAAAQRRSERFHWPNLAAEIHGVYASALRRENGPQGRSSPGIQAQRAQDARAQDALLPSRVA